MKTSIFYENSFGIICHWNAEVIAITDTHISLRFSKNKAYRYKLKETDFVLVTNTKLKLSKLWEDRLDNQTSFNEHARIAIIQAVGDNVSYLHAPNLSNF